MNYYICDLHLFCETQLSGSEKNYDNRPYKTLEEMHSDILKKWNNRVTNGDRVYILGDISKRGKNDELIGLMAKFKGHKVLIKGNHDDISDYRLKQIFEEVCDYKEITDVVDGKTYKVVMSHYPILMWKGQHNGTILLYGHTHTSREDDYFQSCIRHMNNNKVLRHNVDKKIIAVNVGCMLPYMNYEPKTLKELLG